MIATPRAITLWGLGHVPIMPGTLGSLPPVLLALMLRPWITPLALLACLGFGIWACLNQSDEAEAAWGKDPSRVIADETAGMALLLLLAPCGVEFAVWGFVLFRVLDIAKPWPIRRLQRVPGAWGIVLDDLAAGALGAGVLWVYRWVLSGS